MCDVLSLCCRLADAYKTPETDRLSKVDYRRFCEDINTGTGLHALRCVLHLALSAVTAWSEP